MTPSATVAVARKLTLKTSKGDIRRTRMRPIESWAMMGTGVRGSGT